MQTINGGKMPFGKVVVVGREEKGKETRKIPTHVKELMVEEAFERLNLPKENKLYELLYRLLPFDQYASLAFMEKLGYHYPFPSIYKKWVEGALFRDEENKKEWIKFLSTISGMAEGEVKSALEQLVKDMNYVMSVEETPNLKVNREKVEEFKKVLMGESGYERIKEMEFGDKARFFGSMEFATAIAEICDEYDRNENKEKFEPFKKNIRKMLLDKELGDLFFLLYANKYSPRLAMGIIYNSNLGREIMKDTFKDMSIRHPKEIISLIRILKGMFSAKIGRKQAITDFEVLFKIPEEDIHVKGFGKIGMAFENLQAYILHGDEKRLAQFFENNEDDLVHIMRSQEFRNLCEKALQNEDTRERLAKVMMSEKGRELLSLAMKHPEVINTIGYLFADPNGKKLCISLLKHPISGIQTITTILKGQMEFGKTHKTLPYKKFLSEVTRH
jgi:hypothetical protein